MSEKLLFQERQRSCIYTKKFLPQRRVLYEDPKKSLTNRASVRDF